MAATIHIQNQTPNPAVLLLIIAIVVIYVALLFAMPTARQKLLIRSYRPLGRFLFILLCVVILAIISIAAGMVIVSGIPNLYGVFPTEFIIPTGLTFGALFILTFIFPGLAFQDLRNFMKAENSRVATRSVATYSTATKQKRSLPRLINTYFGGTASPQSSISRIARLTYGLLFVAYIFIGAYGLREARFLPTEAHLAFVSQKQIILALIPIGILTFLVLLWQRTPGKGPFRSIAVQKLGFIVLMSAFVIALAVPLLTKGLPDIYSFASSGPVASQNVTVTAIGVRKRKRGCDYTATVALPDNSNTQIQICAVPGEIWDGLRPGHVLTLSGTKTPYGLHYTSIARAVKEQPEIIIPQGD